MNHAGANHRIGDRAVCVTERLHATPELTLGSRPPFAEPPAQELPYVLRWVAHDPYESEPEEHEPRDDQYEDRPVSSTAHLPWNGQQS